MKNKKVTENNKKYIEKGENLGKDWKNFALCFFWIVITLAIIFILKICLFQ